MSWRITIGDYRLSMMERVEILHSVELLSDTASIILPGTCYNKSLELETKIKRGDTVKIELGYDENLFPEFEGYIESIATDGGSVTIKCEDSIFLYRKTLKNRELKNVSVNDILKIVNSEIDSTLSLSCDYDFKYDKFVFSNATGYDVLKKIQEEAKPNIYLKNKVLHVHPLYSEIFGSAKYDFAINIEGDGTDLKYLKSTDRKVMVVVEYTGKDGKQLQYEYGDTGGEKRSKKVSTTDLSSIKNLAKQIHAENIYDGYDGSFTGWLIPYCDSGYTIQLNDSDYEYKSGKYYVLEVKVELSRNGGKRIIKLGKRLS